MQLNTEEIIQRYESMRRGLVDLEKQGKAFTDAAVQLDEELVETENMRPDYYVYPGDPESPWGGLLGAALFDGEGFTVASLLYHDPTIQAAVLSSGTREDVIDWLVWNDGNGIRTDRDSVAEGCNLRTTFLNIVQRAGLTPLPPIFHNLRGSHQTELSERFPVHVVCEWMGNSEDSARKSYNQMYQG